MAVFWLNSSLNRITGVTPFMALFGSDVFLPLTYIIPKVPETDYKDFVSIIEEKQKSLQSVHNFMIGNQANYARILDQNSDPEKYKLSVGDTVYYFTALSPEKGTKKLISHWTGPFLVVKILSDSVVKIKLVNPKSERMKNRLITVNVARIRKIESIDNRDTKYFFTAEPIPNQKYDEDCLADALDQKLEDPLSGQIILGNENQFEISSKNNDNVNDEGNAEIGNQIDDVIDAKPESILDEESGLTDPENSHEPDDLVQPRKAKLDAMRRLKNTFNEILSYLK